MFIKNFLASFSINSCQFYMTKIFWVRFFENEDTANAESIHNMDSNNTPSDQYKFKVDEISN